MKIVTENLLLIIYLILRSIHSGDEEVSDELRIRNMNVDVVLDAIMDVENTITTTIMTRTQPTSREVVVVVQLPQLS